MGLFYTDIPELEGSNCEISLSNLLHLEKKFEGLVEKISAHLDELAYSVVIDGGDFDIVKSILLSIRGDAELDDSGIISENKKDASLIYTQMSLCERLILYRLTCEHFYKRYGMSLSAGLTGKERATLQGVSDRIAYVKNTYNDEAYIKLSSLLQHAKAIYFEDTPSVCRAITDGECDCAILPLEASGARLSMFYELILKHSLYIIAECRIKTPDGYTKYALLQADNMPAHTYKAPKSKNEYAELLLSSDESLCEVLLACEYCGGRVCRADHISGMTLITISIEKCDMEAFSTYLALECPSVRLLGIYKEIK